jgi:hypothetical protein
MLVVGTAAVRLPKTRGPEKGKPVANFVGSRGDTTEGREQARAHAGRGERGQVLLLIILALPLFFALVALVSDGSSLFTNKRSLQNVADASALAAVRDFNSDLSFCAGPDTTINTCLWRIRTRAEDYSSRNGGPTSLPACNDISGPRWNCYKTPYPTSSDNAGIQVRFERTVPFRFGRIIRLTGGSVHAKAAAGLGLPGGASDVSPVGVQQAIAACTMPTASPKCFGPSFPKTLDFDSGGFGYALLNLHCATDTPVANCATGSPTSEMNIFMTSGFPGLLPVNKWYVQNNGAKNGIKQGVDDVIAAGTKLLIPVFDCVSVTPPAVSCSSGTDPAAYHVIGFAAFVIVSRNGWNNGQGHTFTGYFTDYVATGVGGGGTDFGVHVLTLNE